MKLKNIITLASVLCLISCNIADKSSFAQEKNEYEKAQDLIESIIKSNSGQRIKYEPLSLQLDSTNLSIMYDSEAYDQLTDILKLVEKGKTTMGEIKKAEYDMNMFSYSPMYQEAKDKRDEKRAYLNKIQDQLRLRISELRQRDQLLQDQQSPVWLAYHTFKAHDYDNNVHEYVFVLDPTVSNGYGFERSDLEYKQKRLDIVLRTDDLPTILDKFETLDLYE